MRTRVIAAVLAAGAVFAGVQAAHAAPTLHSCEGQLDYACTDPSGAFCTVWRNWSCQLGL